MEQFLLKTLASDFKISSAMLRAVMRHKKWAEDRLVTKDDFKTALNEVRMKEITC